MVLSDVFVDLNGRKRLFGLINALSTVFQVATGNKPIKEKLSMDSGSKCDVSIDVSDFLSFSSDYCFFWLVRYWFCNGKVP